MKPENLLQAMQEIDPAYIAEARPGCKASQGITQTVHAHRTGSSAEKPAPRRTGKEFFMKNHITQRVLTGAVSVAALAVFIGGGWFIAKNAGQIPGTDPAATSTTGEEAACYAANFLGGVGMPYPVNAGTSNKLILADDTRYYSGSNWWSKTENPAVCHPLAYESGSASPITSLMDENLISDGVHIFRVHGNKAYVLNDQGEEYLFYTAENTWQETRISEDEIELTPTPMQDVQIKEILRFSDADGAQWYLVYGTCSNVTNGHSIFMTSVKIQQEGEQFTMVEEYYATSGLLEAYSGAVPSITPDPCFGFWIYSEAEHKVQWLDQTLSCYAEVPLWDTLRNVVILPVGDEIYLCGMDSERGYLWLFLPKDDLGNTDLNILPEQRFRFLADAGNGQLAAVSGDGMSLLLMNADGTNQRTLYTITKDSPWVAGDTPAADELFTTLSDVSGEIFGIGCPKTGKDGEEWMQIDRETGAVRWIYSRMPENIEPAPESEPQETEPVPAEDDHKGETNIFGGTGAIRICFPGDMHTAPVYADDTRYWLCSNSTYVLRDELKNDTAVLHPVETEFPCVITDGERLYTTRDENLYLTDSFGKETLFCESVFPYSAEYGEFAHISYQQVYRVVQNGQAWYAVIGTLYNDDVPFNSTRAILWIDPAEGTSPTVQIIEKNLQFQYSEQNGLYSLTQCGYTNTGMPYGMVTRCFAPCGHAQTELTYLCENPASSGLDGMVLANSWTVHDDLFCCYDIEDVFHCYRVDNNNGTMQEIFSNPDEANEYATWLDGKLYGYKKSLMTGIFETTPLVEFDPVTFAEKTAFEHENWIVTHIIGKAENFLVMDAFDIDDLGTDNGMNYYIFYDEQTGETHTISYNADDFH